ncbi:WD40 repeat domain-containing protein [Actinoplanes sp. KI2]|uniref:WD40 repeat domain-containing protein n=1 Tax=Actinoplanes sp. KI2 TaxID=2983315 RepID=UPI0021D586FA|nr:WD40 repeat domain-containing protein [Actinoplanes sp. KI2]MCU7725604.1 WD40 repeat domain-containing protein [Actinoplanes sp. KI2]
MADLVALLRRLHIRAGKPSLRQLEAWATKQRRVGRHEVVLKRATISEVLAGKRPPGRSFVAWFVEACGVPSGEPVGAWLRAWEAAAEQRYLSSKGVGTPDLPADAETAVLRRIQELAEDHARVRAEIDSLRRQLDKPQRGASPARPHRFAALHPSGFLLTGHTGHVASLAFHHGGELLASGGYDDVIRLWNPRTGEPGQLLVGHSGAVHAVAFSPDGRSLASAAGDQTIRLWDPASGRLIGAPIDTSPSTVYGLAFSVDSRLLAGGTHDWAVKLWDTTTGMPASQPIEAHRGMIRAVAFSPDGRYLATGGDRTVRLWDPVTWSPVGEPLPADADGVWSVAFSPDGRLLAAAGGQTARIWNVNDFQQVGEPIGGHSKRIAGLVFNRDGSLLVTAGGEIRLWSALDATPLGIPVPAQDGPLAICPASDLLAALDDERRIHLWTLDDLPAA